MPCRSCTRFTLDERKRIANDYINGSTTPKLGDIYGVSAGTISAALKSMGVTLRTRSQASRRYAIDEYAFERNTPQRDYWVGMLMADGCICGSSVCLALAEEDAEHIALFKAFLGAGHPVRISQNSKSSFPNAQKVASLCVHSEILARSLESFGVVPRKSKIAKVHKLEMSPAFWLGVLDGDGTVGWLKSKTAPKPNLRIAGSKDLVTQWQSFVRYHLPSCRASVLPLSSIFVMALSSRMADHMLRVLYNSGAMPLKRKLEKANSIMSHYDSIVK